MKNAIKIILLLLPFGLFAQMSSTSYQAADNGSASSGGYAASTNYQNFVVGTWYNKPVMTSTNYTTEGFEIPSGFIFITCDDIDITALSLTLFCDGDSVVLDAGIGFTNYQWSSGQSSQNIAATATDDYYVMVTDSNGCVAGSDTITVTVWDLPEPVISGATDFCEGSIIQLDAGAGFVNYNWSTSEITQMIDVSNTDTIYVQVSDANGCLGVSDTVIVTALSNPIPVITQVGVDSLTTQLASSYQWYKDGTIISGATNRFYQATETGNYTVTVSDANGCEGASASFFLEITGIRNVSGIEDFMLYPNPAKDYVMLQGSITDTDFLYVELQSIVGKKILQTQIPVSNGMFRYSLDVQELAEGNYFLYIKDEINVKVISKITK